MRIVQIVPSLEARHGGPSVSVPALSASLARVGHDVCMVTTGAQDMPPEVLEEHLILQVFRRSRPKFICRSASLRAGLRELAADTLHSHGLWLRPLHYAHEHAQACGLKHVISPRGMMSPWSWRHHRWRKIIADRFIHPGALAAAHGWHATSEAEAADIRALGFQQPICVVPNGIIPPSLESQTRATAYWRTVCPEAFERPTALFYSRLHPKKRVLELIDLWLEQAPRDWLLLVVGIPEAFTVDQLTQYVHRSSGANRVLVFDGADRPPPYVTASIFLLPSHSENFGLVVAEALSHGLPALVTDTTPWQTLQTAGYGWCVPWEKYAATLRQALAEGTDGLRHRGAGAVEWVLEEYSWQKCAHRMADFYVQLGRA